MNWKHTINIILVSGLLQLSAEAQLPPAADLLPPGFKVVNELNQGASVGIEARKPNENFPEAFIDDGISLGISWMQNPVAQQMVQMMLQAPEEPISGLFGQPVDLGKDEPCGKSRYRGGVLTCRKITRPWVGMGDAPDLVTWKLTWMCATDTGLVGVSVSNFYGSKEKALGWIDGVIRKIIESK